MRDINTALSTPEKEILAAGFTYRIEPAYNLSLLDLDNHRVQVRDSQNYAPPETVKQYAAKMRQSTDIPPIVVTEDDWIVDGNTRVSARRVNKEPGCGALIININYETAKPSQQMALRVLAGTLNQSNGVRLRPTELRRQVQAAIQLKWKNDEIVDKLSAPANMVSQVRKEEAGDTKLRKVGLKPDNFTMPMRRAFGDKSVQALNDVPFKECAELAAAAAFTVKEVKALATEMLGTGSDATALEAVRKVRQESEGRIREFRQTGSASPAPSRMLRQHMGFVTKYLTREDELVETNAAVVHEHLLALEIALKVLQKTFELQQDRG